jgi:hypothetical protein
MNNYLDIVIEQLNEIKNSGLYNDTTELLLFITLFNDNNIELKKILEDYDINKKIKIISTPYNIYEKFAIRNYKNHIPQSDDYYIYYIHTKGITKNDNNSFFCKIRKILNFFTLNKYKISIKLLEKYDAVGCSLVKYPKIHFSGNFWWSKKSHIDKLDNNISDSYLSPEMYICSNPDGKYVSLNNHTTNGNLNYFINLNDNFIEKNINDIPINNTDNEKFVIYC